ncbi:MAG: T9SS type A sorting domain-containing protein, partial [Bacteroidales bacterium]|nr:T9SS type A sorting domain-containing protein [Bacteroidales bacterium]
SGDFNPYYHSVEDRVSIFNFLYFHKMAKLSIGSLASLSVPVPEINTSREELFTASDEIQLYNYPNPFNNKTTISYYLLEDAHVNITVMNNLGQQVAVLADSYQNEGNHEISFNRNDLNCGMYFIIANTMSGSTTSKMVIE